MPDKLLPAVSSRKPNEFQKEPRAQADRIPARDDQLSVSRSRPESAMEHWSAQEFAGGVDQADTSSINLQIYALLNDRILHYELYIQFTQGVGL
jgi:hypothetical protein